MITEALVLQPSEGMDDWFIIERAEHEHRGWIETCESDYGSYSTFRWSGRISDADVEGTAMEMRTIAQAIKSRTCESWKRCAVNAVTEPVLFWSPRNSQEPAKVSFAVADALAEQILKTLEGL